MNKARKIVVAGLGAMTPAFIVTDTAQARSAEGAVIGLSQSAAPTMALDQEALKSALLELSPAEKLRIAGDRIRLAKVKAKARASTYKAEKTDVCVGVTALACVTAVVACRAGAPRRAR